MKKVLFLMLVVCGVLTAQSVYQVNPVISTTTILSNTSTHSDTITSLTGVFGDSSLTAGLAVHGAGIPFGSYIKTIIDDYSFTIGNGSVPARASRAYATATATGASIQYEVFTALQYTAGDALGFPFRMPRINNIRSIIVEDDAKQITAVKLVIFNDEFIPILDNAAFAISDTDAKKIIGFHSLTGYEAFSNNQIVYSINSATTPAYPISIGGKAMWGQLIDVGTPTFTATSNLRVTIIGD